MNRGDRTGLCASSSREDLQRSRSTSSWRRTSCSITQDVPGMPFSSVSRGHANQRRWKYKLESPQQTPHTNNHNNNIRRQNWSNHVRERGDKQQRGQRARNNSKFRCYDSNAAIVEDYIAAENRRPTEDMCPNFPGFIFDPVIRKHFRIAPDHSGITNYTPSAIIRNRREKERLGQFTFSRPYGSIASVKRVSSIPTVTAMSELSLGARRLNNVMRTVLEGQLLRLGSMPNAIQETQLGSSGEHVKGCQFLEIVGSSDDTKVLGCWAIGDGSRNSRKSSKMACLRARLDETTASKAAMQMDQTVFRNDHALGNTLGLEFVVDGECIDVPQPVLVDMAIAPVDSDVTCVLYVTAESKVTSQGIASVCNVILQPMSALCSDDDGFEVRNSPIYNIRRSVASSAIYSCAWNSNKTRIALGMEECAKITDVITEKTFKISSCRRNVISQHFAPDGNVIYMGLRDNDVILSDLRMKSHHVTGSLKGSRSSGFIRQLRLSYPNCVLIENFRGDLKLYDIRRTEKEVMSFSGHRNTHFRLSCTVDCQENFVFAVGSDGCTRGWSLRSGEQLCAVPCPRPVDDRTDFPRVVYSCGWDGKTGSSALVLAVGDSLRIHNLNI